MGSAVSYWIVPASRNEGRELVLVEWDADADVARFEEDGGSDCWYVVGLGEGYEWLCSVEKYLGAWDWDPDEVYSSVDIEKRGR